MTQLSREDIASRAATFVNMSAWAPTNDTAVFSEFSPPRAFKSSFVKPGQDSTASYRVMPYVFGGFDDVTAFPSKISRSDRAPGGWDRETGGNTSSFMLTSTRRVTEREGDKQVQKDVTETHPIADQHLAGIDCSGFVSRCWALAEKRGTKGLPDLALEIQVEELKRGDILDIPNDHVILFDAWVGSNHAAAYVYEAQGGRPPGAIRTYRDGDVAGCVSRHDRPLTYFSENGYTPYSPFAQLGTTSPGPGKQPAAQWAGAPIKARILGKQAVSVTAMALDGATVAFAAVPGTDATRHGPCVDVTWTPDRTLGPGQHIVTLSTVHRAGGNSFVDSLSWGFELVA